MDFGILGPLVVSEGGRDLTVAGTKQRLLLAALLVERGRVVSADRLSELLWPEARPANPRNALQSQVSQLRRTLGTEHRDAVEARDPGYVLRVAPEQVDADRFARHLEAAREAVAEGALDLARQRFGAALELWRGPALSGFADEPFAAAEAARLEQLRLVATEERIELELDAGTGAALVPELEMLVGEHPLRERLRGQLMLALYRAGRQADALAVYHDLRQQLGDELGIDPAPELTQRYEALLRQDVPAATATPTSGTAGQQQPPASQLRSGHIPAAFTSFVGRDEDVRRVVSLLRQARLVTLTGPGGVGKTRLAAAAAALRAEDLAEEGTWFVELAPLEDGDLVADMVARTLGLADEGPSGLTGGDVRDPVTRLGAALRHRAALLVLDNCEHLVEGVARFVNELLSRAERLRVLCTSRESLGLTGETVWSVPSLPVPPRDASAGGPTALLDWGAIRLFADRTAAGDPTWTLDDRNVELVVDICRRLDGVPLAIELAAARVRTLGVRELAARLDERFAVLTAGDRTAQPRQQTLRAVVDWSWELLDPPERAVFRRLSVFAAGATLSAAEAVCGDTDPDGIATGQVLDLLSTLVGKSLVAVDHDEGPRYRMLETLRAYGQDRLREAGEWEAFHDRHTDHLLELVRRTVPGLRGRGQLQAMATLDTEFDDLRAALRWCETSEDPDRGARLAVELGWYWYLRGLRVEGLRWMRTFADGAGPREAALLTLWAAFLEVESIDPARTRELFDRAIDALTTHGDASDRAFAHLLAADLSAVMGDHDTVPDHLAAARHAAEEAEDAGYQATADFVAGHQQLMLGDLVAAQPWIEAALEGFREVGDRWGQVQCLMALASDAGMSRGLEAAAEQIDDALDLSRQLRLRELEGILHGRRATLAVLAGDLDRALAAVAEADHISDELGADFLRVNSDLAAGLVALRRGELDAADRRLQDAMRWLEDSPQPLLTTYALARLATVAELRGRTDEAIELAQRAIQVAAAAAAFRTQAVALEALAAAYVAGARPEDAALLLGAAQSRRLADEHNVPEADVVDARRAEAAARAALGDDRFDELVARARELQLDELPLT